jgi:hypothetical protein
LQCDARSSLDDRQILARKLADAERTIATLLPSNQQFAQAERSPEVEDRVRPLLDRAFEVGDGQKSNYPLECRGNVCRLITPDSVNPSWNDNLNGDKDANMTFSRRLFYHGDAYLTVSDDEHIAVLDYMMTVSETFNKSDIVDRCSERYPAVGSLMLEIVFASKSRSVEIVLGGQLSGDPLAHCIEVAFEDLLRTQPLPPTIRYLPEWTLGLQFP